MIDAHAHIFQGLIGYTGGGLVHSLGHGRIRCTSGEERQMLAPSFADNACTYDMLLRYMDMQQVDKAVLMQGGTIGEQNEYTMEACRKHPDRLTGSCTYDPYTTQAKRQLRYITEELGCHILKMECSEEYGLAGYHQDFNYADEHFFELMETAERLGLTVVIDTGTPGTLAYQPGRMKKLISHFPKAQVVIAHIGFPPGDLKDVSGKQAWEEMISLGDLPNVAFDIASLPALGGEDYPYPLAREYVQMVYKQFGADKLLFGTDFPGVLTRCTYQQAINYLKNYCDFLTPTEHHQVFHDNAMRIYKIDA